MYYAVVRCLGIISEASRHLPGEFKETHATLPWREIADAGNVDHHAYNTVRRSVVWETVKTSFPPLLAAVEAELVRRGEPLV
jgi:uncharacterized protein with HEPN domain